MTSNNTRIIEENELRAAQRCSEFHFRGGRIEPSLRTAMLEWVYIKIILNMLRNESFDYQFALNVNINYAVKAFKLNELPPEEASEITRHVTYGINELFKLLEPVAYVPVFGPFIYPVKIADSIVNLHVASILATNPNVHGGQMGKASSVHAVTFSPFASTRDMENDYVQHIKALSIAAANPARVRFTTPVSRIHVFNAGNKLDLNYGCIELPMGADRQAWAEYLETPVKMIEGGFHMPIAPCPHTCIFKSTCKMVPPMRKK